MASPTWWTWVWVDSGTWWWTGRPGVLRFMGLQRVRHNWATELNCTELFLQISFPFKLLHNIEQSSLWHTVGPCRLFFLLLLSHVWLCVPLNCSTPGSSTISWNLRKSLPIESVMLSNGYLILCRPLLLLLQSFPASGSFPKSRLFASGCQSIGASASATSFQGIFRVDFLVRYLF